LRMGNIVATKLFDSIDMGNFEEIIETLEQFLEVPGADLNIKDKNGDSELVFAARLDNTDICQYLLKIVLIVLNDNKDK
jgi:ankyrin repeat protein